MSERPRAPKPGKSPLKGEAPEKQKKPGIDPLRTVPNGYQDWQHIGKHYTEEQMEAVAEAVIAKVNDPVFTADVDHYANEERIPLNLKRLRSRKQLRRAMAAMERYAAEESVRMRREAQEDLARTNPSPTELKERAWSHALAVAAQALGEEWVSRNSGHEPRRQDIDEELSFFEDAIESDEPTAILALCDKMEEEGRKFSHLGRQFNFPTEYDDERSRAERWRGSIEYAQRSGIPVSRMARQILTGLVKDLWDVEGGVVSRLNGFQQDVQHPETIMENRILRLNYQDPGQYAIGRMLMAAGWHRVEWVGGGAPKTEIDPVPAAGGMLPEGFHMAASPRGDVPIARGTHNRVHTMAPSNPVGAREFSPVIRDLLLGRGSQYIWPEMVADKIREAHPDATLTEIWGALRHLTETGTFRMVIAGGGDPSDSRAPVKLEDHRNGHYWVRGNAAIIMYDDRDIAKLHRKV